jgi:hypothetical protein
VGQHRGRLHATVEAHVAGAWDAPGLLLTLAVRDAERASASGELGADERRALVLSLPVCECALLVVTGHSLGAAIAEVATLDLLAAELPPLGCFHSQTFGGT